MSLRMRIVTATGLVVLLTGLTIALVAYFATESRLGVFVEQIGDDEAERLAQNLSRAYTETGGWQTADAVLADAGYAYPGGIGAQASEAGEENHVELLHQDPIRVVIADASGRVVLDNFGRLASGSAPQRLDGRSGSVVDLASNQAVGQVYVDVDHELLSSESDGFLSTLLYIILIGGLVTAGLAISLAYWLSKRVTAPVQALTEATEAIERGDETRLPVTTSDELGRMSDAFNRMSSTLETQRELRRQLVNDVSHELNTPLSVIQLEAAGLRDGLQPAESASEHIIQEVERLRGLVSDLDSLAETDRGALRLKLEAIAVEELLSAELERWQPQAQERRVRLSLQVPVELPDMDLDRGRMSQALGNLLSNSINSVEPAGNVVLSARTEADESLRIAVIDDGAGIAPSDLPYIFDRFYRAEQASQRGIRGTGLGLPITRAIVKAHGGSVTASSEGIGQGATVTIRLPLVSAVTTGPANVPDPEHRSE
ncbi:MAG: HAMP domain-containing histidine kinase [Chloroflexi bacterium]|nr:HAMP domain-containing histidine kinase [Chloroflexota bacterium]MYC02608.1 HAMP domain-containing histidine kinase [Chloroflexota bacterium]